MKILTAKYEGLDGVFTKVRVTVQFEDGTTDEGIFLFENEGRDMDAEGFKNLERVNAEMGDLMSGVDEESTAKLESEIERGMVEYDQPHQAHRDELPLGWSGQPAASEQPEEMGMHNPFESRLDVALDEGIGSAIGGGLGKAAGWAAGQLAAGAKGFVKGAGAAYKGVDAKPAAPAAPAAAKPGMAKPAAAKPVVAGKPAAKKAYEQEVYNKAISSSDEGEFLGNLRYFYNWAKSPQGKDRVVPRQLEKMMAYAVFKYLTNPSFTMSSAKDIMKNVSIPISGADFDGKPEPAGKPEAEAEKTPTPVSVKAPEKAEEPAKKEEPAKAEKPEAKKEPEKEEAKKESKDKNWDGWLSEVVADWV